MQVHPDSGLACGLLPYTHLNVQTTSMNAYIQHDIKFYYAPILKYLYRQEYQYTGIKILFY